jgi:hypothetical protein
MKRVSLRLCVIPASYFDLFGHALESLSLSEVTVEPDAVVHLAEQTRPARPKRLMVEGKTISAIVDWLIPSSERNELEDLEDLCVKYHGDDPAALQAVERLLQCANGLKTLDICLYPRHRQFSFFLSSPRY